MCAAKISDNYIANEASHPVIFHVDVNSAYLSWSALKILQENPDEVDLRTIPSAVGGDIKTRHGVITAKSLPAKKYGVTTGEPVVDALRKCPSLRLVKSDFTFYRKCSAAFIALLRGYGAPVEQVSIDEAYMDVTDILHGRTPLSLADEIRTRIYKELGFSVNVGISENKLLAKMASDFSKPDKTHTLFPSEIPAKMWPLPIGSLFGCGKSTAASLRNLGILTIGDLAAFDPEVLTYTFGEKGGLSLHRHANGISDSNVEEDHGEAKSYSHETTTGIDVDEDNYEQVAIPILRDLGEKVAARLQKDGVRGKCVFVSAKTTEFKRHSRQMQLPEAVSDADTIVQTGIHLLSSLLYTETGLFTSGNKIRLIGIGVSDIDDTQYKQYSLFDLPPAAKPDPDAADRRKKLENMLLMIRGKYGDDSITKGSAKGRIDENK